MGEAKRKREAQRRKVEVMHAEVRKPGYNPAVDPDVRKGIAMTVRAVDFDGVPYGKCLLRALVGLEVLRHCKIDASLHIGSMLYRVGPDPYRDVVAFCGPGNAGFSVGDCAAFHAWLRVGDDIVDFSVGDWFEDAQSGRYLKDELTFFPDAPRPGAVQWTIPEPPNYWWRPHIELTKPWQSRGTPELGQAWYGPFNGDPCVVHENVKQIQADVGPKITRAVETVFERQGRRFRIERLPPDPPAPVMTPIVETSVSPDGWQRTTLREICRIAGLPITNDVPDAEAYVPAMPTTRAEALAMLENMMVSMSPGA